jgi:hypothetical protein
MTKRIQKLVMAVAALAALALGGAVFAQAQTSPSAALNAPACPTVTTSSRAIRQLRTRQSRLPVTPANHSVRVPDTGSGSETLGAENPETGAGSESAHRTRTDRPRTSGRPGVAKRGRLRNRRDRPRARWSSPRDERLAPRRRCLAHAAERASSHQFEPANPAGTARSGIEQSVGMIDDESPDETQSACLVPAIMNRCGP